MIIGIDIDEVLAELIVDILKFYNKKDNTNIEKKDVFHFDFKYIWKLSNEETSNRFYEFFRSENFSKIQPLKGSIEGIQELAKKHELHLITARPDDIKETTLSWIKTHYPTVFKEIHFTNHWGNGVGNPKTKGEICKELNIDLMIEDCLEYALSITSKGIPVILMDQPWNQTNDSFKDIKRVNSWDEAIKEVKIFEKEKN